MDLRTPHRFEDKAALKVYVEEYHKFLKSGTQVERYRLATEGMESLLGFLSVIVVELFELTYLRRETLSNLLLLNRFVQCDRAPENYKFPPSAHRAAQSCGYILVPAKLVAGEPNPEWLYVAQVKQPGLARQSYTPHLEGDVLSIVMEFLSATDGGEYSIRQIPPVGKWFFYEQVLQVPTYIII